MPNTSSAPVDVRGPRSTSRCEHGVHEPFGHRNVKNYDGSWMEYGSLMGAPIELGN